METGRKKMKTRRLSLDGEHWTDAKPIQMDNEADVDKATGGTGIPRTLVTMIVDETGARVTFDDGKTWHPVE